MDYRLWLAGIGIASVLVVWGFHRAGRKRANAHLLSAGMLAEGEVVDCTVTDGRFTFTDITYKYVAAGRGEAVTVRRRLDGRVRMDPGQRVAVRYLPSHPYISIIVGHEARHDAS